VTAGGESAQAGGRAHVRIRLDGGAVHVDTGLPVLDHLVGLLARYGRFSLALELEPGGAEAEVARAGAALGEALSEPLRAPAAPGYGSAAMTASEALAQVVLEAADEPMLVSNVDLSQARVAGLATDLADRFLRRFAEGAGLNVHVRLVHGTDTQHVLDAIFKALGVALADAVAAGR
jgi:imidazoleglycerol-phosphate dehydratase